MNRDLRSEEVHTTPKRHQLLCAMPGLVSVKVYRFTKSRCTWRPSAWVKRCGRTVRERVVRSVRRVRRVSHSSGGVSLVYRGFSS